VVQRSGRTASNETSKKMVAIAAKRLMPPAGHLMLKGISSSGILFFLLLI